MSAARIAFVLMLAAVAALCGALALLWSVGGALIAAAILLFLLACMVYNESAEHEPGR